MDILSSLTKLGLSSKEASVYVTLLGLGPSPVRKIALKTTINRGTTYDLLKSLQGHGLVSYYHAKTHQYFVAEDPEKLLELLRERRELLTSVEETVKTIVPELQSLLVQGRTKPVVKYYRGEGGTRNILLDVLDVMAKHKEQPYRVYSSANIREYLYRSFSDFTKRRIDAKLAVRVLSLGKGGEDAPYSERKWLLLESRASTYRIIYGNRIAFISLDPTKELHGVIVEDEGIAETERILFDALWGRV